MLEQLIEKNRSYRKFHEAEEVKPATLKELVTLSTLALHRQNMANNHYI